jgi:fumarate reductase flavoprotein subunit
MANTKRSSTAPGKKAAVKKACATVEFIEPKVIEAVRNLGKKYILDKWTYRLPDAAILPEEIKETYNTDVLIVGAGTSGKAAALHAAYAGAKVIQIDRHTTYRWGGGHIAAIDSELQKRLGVKLDKVEICLQLQRYSMNNTNQKLYRLWADTSGAIIDWIMGMTDPEGIETRLYQWPWPKAFNPKQLYYPEYPVCHWQVSGESRSINHSLALNILEREALKKGVDIRYQTRAVQLIRQGNGRVTGLIARDKKGNLVQYNARRAVVLCTGDYGNNPWMMQKYCSHFADIALASNIYMVQHEDLIKAPEPLNTGDGHQMAMRIGAVMEPGPHAAVAHAAWAGPLGSDPFLWVNAFGERYQNEDVPQQSIANAMGRQPGHISWQVFDSNWENDLPKMGIGLGKYFQVYEKLRYNVERGAVNIEDAQKLRQGVDVPIMDYAACKANTIEELAVKMGIPPKTFKATVDRYNELCRLGNDLDYGKYAAYLTPIVKPPFFAGRARRDFLVAVSGLNTNLDMQPLDADWKAIKGLYLAGNTVGNRWASDYPTMCPGMTHGMAYVTGRIAGINAAKA